MAQTLRTPILAKCGLAKCGQHFETLILATSSLAKCAHENDLAKFVFFWRNAVLVKCGHDRPDGGGREAQHSTLRTNSRTDVMSQLELHEQALFRSQSGPLAGVPFIGTPKSPETRKEPQIFRVLLPRRLWCPSPLCVASCRCGRPLDPCGHHHAACPHAGVLGRRGSRQQHACVERPEHAFRPMFVCRTWTSPPRDAGNRRIEVVADGLPLFHGAQLAIDTTLVSPLSRNGAAKRQCAGTDGAAMVQARQRKERTYPVLAQVHGRARLVVLACEVGGRWSGELLRFLYLVAEAKVRGELEEFRDLVNRAWMTRWSSLLACTAARALALFLLERRCSRLRWRGAIHFRSGL